MDEIWKVIEGTNYSVSNLGNVRNNLTGFILKGSEDGHGYLMVNLRVYTRNIHVLVANAFVTKPVGNDLTVNHKDCNKLNNIWSNLEWITRSANSKHAIANGLIKIKGGSEKGSKNPRSKLTETDIPIIRLRVHNGESMNTVGRDYKVSPGTISDIISGKTWSHVC